MHFNLFCGKKYFWYKTQINLYSSKNGFNGKIDVPYKYNHGCSFCCDKKLSSMGV